MRRAHVAGIHECMLDSESRQLHRHRNVRECVLVVLERERELASSCVRE